MKTYYNKKHSKLLAEQREDGNYNVYLKGEKDYLGYSVHLAKEIEGGEEWAEAEHRFKYESTFKPEEIFWMKDRKEVDKEWEEITSKIKEEMNKPHHISYPPQEIYESTKTDKPQILSILTKEHGALYLNSPYKSSTIKEFFTNGSDIWVNLYNKEQYKVE